MPQPLQQTVKSESLQTTQSSVTVFPYFAPCHLHSSHRADPTLQEVMTFWQRKEQPNGNEWQGLSHSALVLLSQLDHLVELDGMMYWLVFQPDGVGRCTNFFYPRLLLRIFLARFIRSTGTKGSNEP